MKLSTRRQAIRSVALFMIACQLGSLSGIAVANPKGGTVVGGQAVINQAIAGVTAIKQSSDRAVINWQSFSNSVGEAIRFQQPGAQSATLNRITGGDPSVINGMMSANGHVFILNPNGVLFGSTAQVNVGGLTASTLDMSNDQFMSGSKIGTLAQDPSKSLGSVVNKGTITAGSGGVTLVAPLVDNEGTIIASDGGKVNLGAGREATVSLDNQGLMNVNVHLGPAGDVHTSKQAVSDLIESAVDDESVVVAGSVKENGDDVVLGGAEGIAMNAGSIHTDGAPGVAAGDVRIDSTQLTALTPGSLITANGVGANSNGGHVKVTSRGDTLFGAGSSIEARGGDTGDGGLVETSADEGLIPNGDVDTRAPGGNSGSWLLDPTYLSVISGTSGTGDQDGSVHLVSTNLAGLVGADTSTTLNTITDGKINAQIQTTDVILEATGHIKIGSGVSINLAGSRNLYFHVINTIDDGNTQISGPAISFAQIQNLNATDSGKVVFVVDKPTNPGLTKNASNIDLSNVGIDGANGGVFITAPGSVTVDQLKAQGSSGIINITAGGSILQSTPSNFGPAAGIYAPSILLKASGIGTATAPVLTVTPSLLVDQNAGGNVFITNSQNALTVANNPGTGSFSLTNTGGDITVGSVTVASTMISSIQGYALGTFNGTFLGEGPTTGLTANSSSLTLNASGHITTAGSATLSAVSANLTAVTGISSPNTLTLSSLVAQNTGTGATGDINLINSGTLTFGALNTSATGKIILAQSGGGLTVGSSNVKGNGDVTLTVAGANDITLTGTTAAGAANTVSISTAGGSINGAGTVSGGTALLTGPKGIGNSTSLNTAVQNLDAHSTGASGGGIAIANSGGAVTVAANTDSGSIDISNTGGNLTAGAVGVDTGVTDTSASGTISLRAKTSGDISLSNAVTSQNGSIGLVAAGNVALGAAVNTQADNNSATVVVIAQAGTITRTLGTITAGAVGLDATAGIGLSGARLGTSTSKLQLGGLSVGGTLVPNGGDDFVGNTGPIALTLAGTSSGIIDVTQSGASLTVDSITLSGIVPSAVTAATETGLTGSGTTKLISLVTTGAGGIVVNQAIGSTDGNIGLVATGGIALAANVSTGNSGDASQVDLIAQGGSITRSGGDVTAGNVAVAATTGIGAGNARLNTSTSKLQVGGLNVNGGAAVVNGGDDYFANTGGVALTIAGTAGNTVPGVFDIAQDNASLTIGSLTIGAFSSAGVTVASANEKGITDNGSTNTISLVSTTAGSILVNNAVTSNDGNIGIISIAGITLGANVTTGNSTDAKQVDLIAQGGTIAQTAGKVTGGNVAIAATGGVGSATARINTATSNIQLGGLSINGGSAVVNGSDDFIANSGAHALTVAGNDASGVIDVTQDGASLTVGTLTIGAFDPAAPATSAAKVTSAIQTGLTDTGATKTISLFTTTAGAILVNSAVASSDGSIGIIAHDGITVGANVTTGVNNDASLVDLIAQGGGIGYTAGTVTAGHVAVDATGGIGSAIAPLSAATSNLQLGGLSVNASGVTNAGDDFVANSVKATVAGSNGTGVFDIRQTGADLTVGSLTDGAFAPPGAGSAAIVTSVGEAGLIDSGSTKTISLVTLAAGSIFVNNAISSTNGDIGIIASTGVSLGADVQTNSASAAGLVDVIAQNGSITHSTGNIIALKTAMAATAGIGTATARVATKTTQVQLGGLTINGAGSPVVNGGDDYIANTGGNALTVAGNNASGVFDFTQDNASLTVDALAIGAFAPAAGNSAASITSANQPGLADAGSTKTISLYTTTAGSILVNQPVTTNDGDIGIIAKVGVALGADVQTDAASAKGLVDVIAQGGSITWSAGHITSLQTAMAATNKIGTSTARVATKTTQLQLGGLTINNAASAVVNAGNDYIANSGPNALKVAGNNAAGAFDITQAGASLTVDALSIGAFAPASANSAASVTSANQAGLSLATLANTISLFTTGGGSIIVNQPVATNDGNIGIIADAGITLGAGVTTGVNNDTSLVDLIAQAGSIIQSAGLVTAGTIGVAATGGIGTGATARVNTSTSKLQLGGLTVNGALSPVSNGGDDYLKNTGGVGLTVAGNNASGLFDLTQDSADLTLGSLTIGAFDPGTPNSAVKITSTNQVGLADAGSTKTISLVTLTSGSILVSNAITSNQGDIGIIAKGGISLGADVQTDAASTKGLVDVIAQGGSITHSAGNITALQTAMAATGGVGTATQRVATKTTQLQLGGLTVNSPLPAVVNGGDDYIANTGGKPLTVAGNDASGVLDITQAGANLTVNALSIGAFAPAGASSAASVTSVNQPGLALATTAKTISLYTTAGGSILINQPVATADGNIGLIADAGITLGANVTTGANADSSLTDLIAQAGSITQSAGLVTAGTVAMAATGGIGTGATARVNTSTSKLQLGGLTVNGAGSPVSNGGDDFLKNTGGVGLTVAGNNASGVFDLTQDSADLTLGSLTIGAFDPATPSSAVKITSTNQLGLADAGSTKTISLVTLTSGSILVNDGITSTNGDIGIIAKTGVSLGADVQTNAASTVGLVDVIAQGGSITHSAGNLIALKTAMAATGGIGTATARVATKTTQLQLGDLSVNGAPAVVNGGDDFIANAGAHALTVSGANASGVFDLTQDNANLTVDTFLANAFAFDPAFANSAASITSASLPGLAGGGATKTISLFTTTLGNILVNQPVTTNDGSIGIIAHDGITVGAGVSTTVNNDASLVDLIAQGGAITNTAGTVTAGHVAVDAAGGIGTPGIGALATPLSVATSNLQLGGLSVNGTPLTNAGDDVVANSVKMIVAGGSSTGLIDVRQTGFDMTVSTLTDGGFAPAGGSSAASVTSANQSGLTASFAGKAISLVTKTAGSILVNNAVTSSDGNIGLISIGGITLGANVTTGKTADASLVDLVAQGGTITRSAGTVTAGNVAVDATGGAGAAGARINTSTSNLQLGGLSVNAGAVTNGGDDFFANTGGVPLTVAGATGSGVIDITQTAASLTVGTLNLGGFPPVSGLATITSANQVGLTDTSAAKTITLATLTSGDIIFSNTATDAGSAVVASAVGNITHGVAAGSDISASAATLTAGGSTGIGTATSPLVVSVNTLTATATKGAAFFTSSGAAGTTVSGSAVSNFQLSQTAGNLSLLGINSGRVIVLDATAGSILDGSGGTLVNLTSSSGFQNILTAAGTIGTRAQALNVNINPGSLEVAASGTDGTGVSVNINGTVLPDDTLVLSGSYPGSVIFNGSVRSTDAFTTGQGSGSLAFTLAPGGIQVVDLSTLTPSDYGLTPNLIFLGVPYRQDDYVESDAAGAESDQSDQPDSDQSESERLKARRSE